MDRRASLGGQRPPPQRAVSGGSYGLSHPAPKRPALPSGLSHMRSVSHPVNVVDLTSDGTISAQNNVAAFVGNGEAVVTSPDVINLEDDIEEPPAKRAKILGEEFKAETIVAPSDGIPIPPGTPLPSLPRPKRPGSRSDRQSDRQSTIDPASRKAHGIGPPALATRLPPPKKAADFSPWTGNHAEDVLNEQVIKNGYMDKAQGANQAESNSAKAAMSSGMNQKNSPGLGLVSWMFAQALEKRQVLGKITIPSAFKPPPRVTVTDTKREAWLRDLANPEVPLRKQSRTIPHGIRGKLLMEQCLSKAIPLQRAVWLAKCVGANELRAFRRKGVSGSAAASGEFKWVREWTVHVEQFLEDVVASCGQEGWRDKMNYAVKLCTAFYSEKLLDAEHYLDWIVSSLANASLERLPIWIILTQLYWKEIVCFVRRGRRLAEGILEQLDSIIKSGVEAHGTLRLRLQKLLAVLASSNRGCLVIPRTWERYKPLLTPNDTTSAMHTPAANIKKRNERLVGPTLKTAANTRSPLLDLYDGFDSINIESDLNKLASKSLHLVPDIPQLVAAILDWASMRYRTGLARVFVSATLVANLHSSGYDTDAGILRFLAQATALTDLSIDLVHRVIVELYRLQAFSISRYFQWLLVSGTSLARGGSVCAIRLITALSTDDLPPHLRNTRNTLVKRLGIVIDEDSTRDGVLRNLDDALSREDATSFESVELPSDLSLATKHSICQQISIKLGRLAKDVGVGLQAFTICRDVVERLQGIRSLASLVTSSTTTNNSTLLATVVDTINLHADSFAALGEFKRLSDAVIEQYSLLRSQQPLDRTLILALTDLTRRIPEKAAYVKMLEQDLVMCDQQYSAVVCSPASDSLIGMHASNIDSDEDIDAVFASGNTMDEQLMQRVFVRIMQRTLKPIAPEPGTGNRIPSWLNQLRSVEGSGAFEHIVENHIRAIVGSDAGDSLPMASLVHLVVSGCSSLALVADIVKSISASQTAADILPLFMSTSVTEGIGLHEVERYRFRLYQSRCREQHTEALARILRTTYGAAHLEITNEDLLTFVVWCFSAKPEVANLILTDSDVYDQARAAVGSIVGAILIPEHLQNDTAIEVDIKIRQIISQANPLSVRHGVAALKYYIAALPVGEMDDGKVADVMIQTFRDGSSVWPQLLENAGEDVNRNVHSWVRETLLREAAGEIETDATMAQNDVARHLDLLSVTAGLAKVAEDTEAIAGVTNLFKLLDNALLQTDNFEAESGNHFHALISQLRLALDLCVLLIHGDSDDKEASQQAESGLLFALCILLVHPSLQSNLDLVEYLFDLASTLADKLFDTAYSLDDLQATSAFPSDARLTSILGITEDPLDSWLLLESKVQPSGSQQQRALNKHVPQQQQQSTGLPSPQGSGQQGMHPPHQRVPSFGLHRQDSRMPEEKRLTPFPLHSWEIMPEVSGDNNTSLDLKLFGARKV